LIIASYFFATLGYALLATLDERSNRASQMLYLLVAALGVGPLFQLPLLHLQAAMPVKDLATSTATLALLRSVGGTVGIAVAGAIYASKLRSGLEGIDGWAEYAAQNGRGTSSAAGSVEGLTGIEPPELRRQVLHVYTRSLSYPWVRPRPSLSSASTARTLADAARTPSFPLARPQIIAAPLLFVGLVASVVGIKHYSMVRATVHAPEAVKVAKKGKKKGGEDEEEERRKGDEVELELEREKKGDEESA